MLTSLLFVFSQGKGLYLVKWVGYDASDNTWEPIQHLDSAKELLKAFYEKRIQQREKATPKE